MVLEMSRYSEGTSWRAKLNSILGVNRPEPRLHPLAIRSAGGVIDDSVYGLSGWETPPPAPPPPLPPRPPPPARWTSGPQYIRGNRPREPARPAATPPIYDFSRTCCSRHGAGRTEEEREQRLRHMRVQRHRQAMAKGWRTRFYQYHRLNALNRSGWGAGALRHLGGRFHLAPERAEQWPSSMRTTSTHDKQGGGADVRAPHLACSRGARNGSAGRAGAVNARNRTRRPKAPPRRRTTSTLLPDGVGAGPMGASTRGGAAAFRERLVASMTKAGRRPRPTAG